MNLIRRLDSSARFALLLAACSALAGMALVAYATTAGAGVGGDATIYLTTARNFLLGHGLGWIDADGTYRLLPYTPPFYPIMLSAVGLFTRDLVAGARWLNVLLFGATVLGLGWFTYRATARAWLGGLLAGLLATSPVLLGVQVWAMSEPLFLFTGFASLLLLLAALETPRRGLFLLSALLAGLAFLTRYLGVAYVGAACLGLLFLPRALPQPPARRWRDALLYGAIAVLPILVWMAISYLLTGAVSSRSAQPASAYLERFLEMGPALQRIFLFWLLPDSLIDRLPGALRLLGLLLPLLALAGLAVWLVRRLSVTLPGNNLRYADLPDLRLPVRLALLSGLFIFVYLVALVFVQVFTYPPVTLASRMLSPVHLAALVLLLTLLHLFLYLLGRDSPDAGPRRVVPAARILVFVPALVYLAAGALLGAYALRGALIAREYHQSGIGYNAPAWRDAPILQAVRGLPASVPLVSNEVTALMYLADRPAYTLQEIFQSQPQETFTAYGEGPDESQRVFREEGAALVLFNATLRDDFAMYGDRLDERLAALTRGLRLHYQGQDGAIYFYK